VKLYDLVSQYNQVLEMAEEVDVETLKDTLESIQESIEEKAQNTAKLIKSMEVDTKALKEEEQRLADRRKSLENKISSIKEYLQTQLEIAGIDKVKGPILTVSIQNNPPSVKVIDDKLLSAYMVPVEPKLDKKTLLSDLKSGKEVPGAEIQQGRSVRIR
jgi:predicted nuclease with TOPRIM domain